MIAEPERSKFRREQQEQRPETIRETLAKARNIQPQPSQPAGKKQAARRSIHLRIDERQMRTMYGNAFRAIATPEELILDFGRAEVRRRQGPEGPIDVKIKAEQRCIMTYYSAKRMALLLGKVIRRYEKKFGPIEVRSYRIDQEVRPGD